MTVDNRNVIFYSGQQRNMWFKVKECSTFYTISRQFYVVFFFVFFYCNMSFRVTAIRISLYFSACNNFYPYMSFIVLVPSSFHLNSSNRLHVNFCYYHQLIYRSICPVSLNYPSSIPSLVPRKCQIPVSGFEQQAVSWEFTFSFLTHIFYQWLSQIIHIYVTSNLFSIL